MTTTPAPSKSLSFAFTLVTSLFFMWGFSYGLLDVMNRHFQDTLHITRARSAWLQMSYFGAYFVIALPAATLAMRHGYKAALLSGLCLFAAGALLIVPSTLIESFPCFLLSLFVIACGLGCLETAANPYVTLLGDPAHAEQRLNLSQLFNGVGQSAGPWIGGSLVFAGAAGAAAQAPVRLIYVGIAVVVMAIAILIWRTPMPEPQPERDDAMGDSSAPGPALLGQRHFVWGVIAQFFYVGAQVGAGAFFINYLTELHAGLSSMSASRLLTLALALFMAGRIIGTILMSWIAPRRLLTLYAVINVGLSAVVAMALPAVSVVALIALFFFMSIMFPTIFALAVRNLGTRTKRASSYLIMSIVGGAIAPYLMGWLGDRHGMPVAYLLPAACFAIVALYGWKFALPAR